MKALSIAWKDVLILFRDKKALATILLMPVVLIAILGTALGPIFGKDTQLSSFKVAVVDQDRGEVSKGLLDGLGTGELKNILKVEKLPEKEAREKVSKGEIPVALILPKGFTVAVKEGKPVSVKVLGDPGNKLQSSIFRSIVDKFTGSVSAAQVGIKAVIGVLIGRGYTEEQIYTAMPELIRHFSSQQGTEMIEVKQEPVEGRKTVSALQYYSAGMMVMYILFVGMLGIKSILEEREKNTLMRVLTTGTSRFTVLFGKFLGIFAAGCLQVIILIVFTSLAMGVHWGISYGGIAILAAASVFAMAGLSMLVAALAKTSRAAEVMASMGIQVMALLGGSMIPMDIMPAAVKLISKFTINGWALTGFLRLMENQDMTAIVSPALVLLGIGAGGLVLGAWRLTANPGVKA